MNKKIVEKGYTLEVTSWENDGDNYKTKKITLQDKDLAITIAKMCKELFCSCNNGEGGIGNTNEGDEDEAEETILTYLENNNNVLHSILNYLDVKKLLYSNNDKISAIMEINRRVMGSSEYYYSRVFESCQLYYSPEDINIELIEF